MQSWSVDDVCRGEFVRRWVEANRQSSHLWLVTFGEFARECLMSHITGGWLIRWLFNRNERLMNFRMCFFCLLLIRINIRKRMLRRGRIGTRKLNIETSHPHYGGLILSLSLFLVNMQKKWSTCRWLYSAALLAILPRFLGSKRNW